MKNRILPASLIVAALAMFSCPALANAPVINKVQFTNVKCDAESKSPAPTEDTIISSDETEFVKIECSADAIKKYPFLKDLTKDEIEKGGNYTFNIARIEDKALVKPVLVVNMLNPVIYTDWGSTGAYGINDKGVYYPMWNVGGGTTVYTASCPKQLSFILASNAEKKFTRWAYNGKEIQKLGDYDTLESLPACD